MKKIITLLALVFCLNANAQYTKLLDFGGTTDGAAPYYSSFIFDGTFLYGTTIAGGTLGNGIVFKIKPDGSGFVNLLNFQGGNGMWPYGSLTYDGTYLYGMTTLGGNGSGCNGGPFGCGTIFKIKPDGTGYLYLLYLSSPANGTEPMGSLIFDSTQTYLYGMTYIGGTNDSGVVFKTKPDGTGYINLLNFAGVTNGAKPIGSLYFDGSFIYGMTGSGGTNRKGTIFKIKSDGTGYAKLLDFAGATNGSYPSGSLIFDGSYFYGMTSKGGTNDLGTIFKIMPNGTGYAKLLDFAGAITGSSPYGSLIFDSTKTYLYGMTEQGGINNDGTVFKIKTDGTGYNALINFSGVADGSNPYGSLFLNAGCLYGMTNSGGANNHGTIFSYCNAASGISETLGQNIKISVYPNPTNNNFTIETNNNSKQTLQVYDVNGKLVLTQTINGKTIIDAATLADGVYNLSLISNEAVINKRLVIVR